MLANEEEIWGIQLFLVLKTLFLIMLEILKNRLNDENVRAIFIRSTLLESIQLHLMQDKRFILSLLANASEDLWHVLVNIAQHPGKLLTLLQSSKVYQIAKQCFLQKLCCKRARQRAYPP